MKILKNVRLLSTFTILTLITTASLAESDNCPNGSFQSITQIKNPRTSEILTFDCKNDTRREFIKIDEFANEKIVATAFNNLNEATGKETLSLNTLNIFRNKVAVQFEKYGPTGQLERLEKYRDQITILKYIEKAQRHEEYNITEKTEPVLKRECFFSGEKNKLTEKLHGETSLETTLTFVEVNEEKASAIMSQNLIISNKDLKVEFIELDKSISILLNKFSIETCLYRSFIPKHASGDVVFGKNKYVMKDNIVELDDLKNLVNKYKKREIVKLLENNAEEIIDLSTSSTDIKEQSEISTNN